MRYEVDKDNIVHMWDDVNPEPFLFQPHYPNGDSFDTKEEAETWAQYKLEELTIEEAPQAPLGKGFDPEPKPTPMQAAEMKLARIGLGVDELKSLLGLNG
jgi:hypothetical protein